MDYGVSFKIAVTHRVKYSDKKFTLPRPAYSKPLVLIGLQYQPDMAVYYMNKKKTRKQSVSISTINAANIVRWYVLQLPSGHRGGVKGLTSEQNRRKKYNLPLLEYFWPTCVEKIKRNGKWISTSQPLYYNYIFVHASENEIYDMKRTSFFKIFNFLPRVRSATMDYYPYVEDKDMVTLKWIASSYSNEIPIFFPKTGLLRGDRIRITDGQFAGTEAIVVIQKGQCKKTILVQIQNWACVPLINVEEGQYEIIDLNKDKKHIYKRLDNYVLADKLHQALGRFHKGILTEEDLSLANQTLKEYGSEEMREMARRNTKLVARSKLYLLLLPAYTILRKIEDCKQVIAEMLDVLTQTHAPQISALIYVTLYGCTDNYRYHQAAHELVDGWVNDANPTKKKRLLMQRLSDYDLWFGHSISIPSSYLQRSVYAFGEQSEGNRFLERVF